MVIYKIRKMKIKTFVVFFSLVWIFSAICAITGAIVINFTVISSKTPFDARENRIVEEIWQDLGPFQGYQTPNATGYPVWGTVTKEGIRTYFTDFEDKNKSLFSELAVLFIELQNGSVHYNNEEERLVFFFFNSTRYECKSPRDSVRINIVDTRFELEYRQDEDQLLIKTGTGEGSGQSSSFEKFNYFDVRNRDIIGIFSSLWMEALDNFVPLFIEVGLPFLFAIAIGGGIGITTSIVLSLFRITRVGGGRKWSYFILRILRGRVGKLLSHIPFFDFGGEWYIEESFVDTIDFSSTKLTFNELFSERLYDLLIFPPLLASSIMYIFMMADFAKGYLFLLSGPFISPIVLILLTFYYPLVWQLDEAGIKKMEVGVQGDIVSIKPLGNIIRDGLGVIIGFSGIISVASFGVEITREFNVQENVEFVGISFDWFGFLLLILMTVGMFLVLCSSTIVGATIIAVNYLQTSHISGIENLRKKSEENKLISNFGSTQYQFHPTSTDLIIQKED